MNCGAQPGTFAFFPADESELTEMQQPYYYPPQFNRFTPPILFSENRTVWMAYKPDMRDYQSPYALSLSKESLGWIEINLQNHTLLPDSKYIVNKYENLSVGKYLLRVAHDNETLGSIEFEIISDASQTEDYIDYEAPIEVVLDAESDDIRMLSE
ncbi:MAG: hypothetical protein ABUK01_08210 [Leptospirales bacterium]